MRKLSNRRLPRCNAEIKPKKKYTTKSGLERSKPRLGEPNNQRCLRSINCPHHRVQNSRVPLLEPIAEQVFPLTWERVKELINQGCREETGRNYYQ